MKLTLATVFSAALIVHGLGHIGGYWMLGNSWLLAGSLGETTARLIGSLLWVVPMAGFLGAGLAVLGYIGNPGLWRKQAIISAGISLAVIAVFAGAGSTWNISGAIIGNVVALGAVTIGSFWTPGQAASVLRVSR